jgi:Putative redox-active protein (C_GCAxxG_C_C)
MEDDMMLKVVSGFAGGNSRMKSVCGALPTGILILGINFGREKEHLDKFENLLESYPPLQHLFI